MRGRRVSERWMRCEYGHRRCCWHPPGAAASSILPTLVVALWLVARLAEAQVRSSPLAGATATAAPSSSAASTGTPGAPDIQIQHRLQPRQDLSRSSAQIPADTIVVTIQDPSGNPVPRVSVALTDQHHGGSGRGRSVIRSALTDPKGRVVFSQVPARAAGAHQVVARHDSATYASPPFALRPGQGQELLIHVYPSTDQLAHTQVAMRGLLYVELLRESLRFQMFFRALNLGASTWLPHGVSLQLPNGVTAIVAPPSAGSLQFIATGSSEVRLEGAVPPGQTEAGFQFQLPAPRHATACFILPMPPRVVQMRVLSDAPPGLRLQVAGFPPSAETPGPQGQRMLAAEKTLQPSDPPLAALTVALIGVPSSSWARWLVVAIALAFSLSGLIAASAASRRQRQSRRNPAIARIREARRLLLDELVALERARRVDRIGARTYQQTHHRLLDALARIEHARETHLSAIRPPRPHGQRSGR